MDADYIRRQKASAVHCGHNVCNCGDPVPVGVEGPSKITCPDCGHDCFQHDIRSLDDAPTCDVEGCDCTRTPFGIAHQLLITERLARPAVAPPSRESVEADVAHIRAMMEQAEKRILDPEDSSDPHLQEAAIYSRVLAALAATPCKGGNDG